MLSAVLRGVDLPLLPEYFVKLADEKAQMLKRQRLLGYLPVRANAKDGAAILDARTGAFLSLRLLPPRFDAPKPKPPSETPRTLLSGPRNGVT